MSSKKHKQYLRFVSWLVYKWLYPLWGATVCHLGKHINKSWIYGSKNNFCEGCGKEVSNEIYHCFDVKSNDGEFHRLIYAVNRLHALTLLKHLYHESNLNLIDKGVAYGMTKKEWYESVSDIISTMPDNVRAGWMP